MRVDLQDGYARSAYRQWEEEMIIGLIFACAILYFIGGQKWAHTLFRDLGCSLCIFALAWFIYGFSWPLLLIIPICWGGFSVGDHEVWYWIPHAFIISLCMLPYAVVNSDYICFGLMMAVVIGGTYVVSRFLNRFGIDVILRGILYATIPLYFLI